VRVVIHAAIACSVVLTPIGYADAAKTIHRSHPVDFNRDIPGGPGLHVGNPVGNAAADGNNANSMSGSNSAVENAIGRTNCC
jgi:hypothetical protein